MENKKTGRPKLKETKKQITLRLPQECVDKIKSQPNQSLYIENLIKNKNGNT